MSKYVVFLQNAWSPVYAGKRWPRHSWLEALDKCKSGKKLKIMIGDDLTRVYNTTSAVSKWAGGVEEPDHALMDAIIRKERPKFIVACGLQAEAAVKQVWSGSLVVVPHPACRWLKDDFYRAVGIYLKYLDPEAIFKLRFWQKKGEDMKIDLI